MRRLALCLALSLGVLWPILAPIHPTRAAKNVPTVRVLWSFGGVGDGSYPRAGLLADATGALYGTTERGGAYRVGTVFKLVPSGPTYAESVLWSFRVSKSDGFGPRAGLITDSSGALYGTTEHGGVTCGPSCPPQPESEVTPRPFSAPVDGGTAFKLTPSGSAYAESVLWNFGIHTSDGRWPLAGLIADGKGDFYGTTTGGGGGCYVRGCGTVFELSPSGPGYAERVLWVFGSRGDGDGPQAGLITDATGALYGTTYYGGAHGHGTVFKLTPSSSGYTERVLWSFGGVGDGTEPFAGLFADEAGALYGTTSHGGAYGPSSGYGTVFKLTPSGSSYTERVIWSFGNGLDGIDPRAGLIADRAGALYGTTVAGGAHKQGTVFKLTPSRSGYAEHVLHSFQGGSDGANPLGGLIADAAGALYGTTEHGGTYKLGTVFKVTQ